MLTASPSPQVALAVFVILVGGDAFGRTIIVDQAHPHASDDGPATREKPFETISAAAAMASPGDTVLVHEGIYRERVAPVRGGEAGKPIVYQAVVRERVVIKGSDLFAPRWEAVGDAPYVYFGQFPEDLFPAGGITWDTAPANDPGSGGGAFDEEKQRGGGVDASRTVYLGTFEMDNAGYVLSRGTGHEVNFGSKALSDFLNRDTNGLVTLILTRITRSGSLMCAFASKESSGKPGPTLEVEVESGGEVRTIVIPTKEGRGADALVDTKRKTQNQGSADRIWSTRAGTNRKAYIRFDLSSLPRGRIRRAALKLSVVGPTGQGRQSHNVFGLRDGDAGELWLETGRISPGWRHPFRTPLKSAPDKKKLVIGQIFVNGRPLLQLDDLGNVGETPGSWMVAEDGRGLFVQFPEDVESPGDCEVEITTRNRVFAPHRRGLGHIHVRGFVIEQCANQFPSGFWSSDSPQEGALGCRGGHHWVIEGNVVRHATSVGIDCGSEGRHDLEGSQPEPTRVGHHLIRGNRISDNGACGIAGYRSLRTKIVGNVVERNNWLRFAAPEIAGIKTHFFVGGLIEGNLIRDNHASGIWLDNVYAHARVTRNVVVGNTKSGIMVEMGGGPVLIDNNVIGRTRPPRKSTTDSIGDLYGHDSSGITFAHNLVFGTTMFAVHLRALTGRSYSVYPEDIQTWETEPVARHPCASSNHRIVNNIFMVQKGKLYNLPYPGPKAEGYVCDGNLVYREAGCVINKRGGTSTDDIVAHCRRVIGREPGLWWGGGGVFVDWDEWKKLMHLGADSTVAKSLTVALTDDVPMRLRIECDDSLEKVATQSVSGIDADFFGRDLPSRALPGPFQGLKVGRNELTLPGYGARGKD